MIVSSHSFGEITWTTLTTLTTSLTDLTTLVPTLLYPHLAPYAYPTHFSPTLTLTWVHLSLLCLNSPILLDCLGHFEWSIDTPVNDHVTCWKGGPFKSNELRETFCSHELSWGDHVTFVKGAVTEGG